MQIVIDIPESVYCTIKPTGLKPMLYTKNTVETLFLEMANAIRNGTPLPKGHGRLIDLEVLKAVLPAYVFRGEQGQFCKVCDMDKIPSFAVVLEADKEVDE